MGTLECKESVVQPALKAGFFYLNGFNLKVWKKNYTGKDKAKRKK
jgi:hypothetical protein